MYIKPPAQCWAHGKCSINKGPCLLSFLNEWTSLCPENLTQLDFFLSFLSFRASPAAFGGSQARGPIGALAARLHCSHSNSGSELCLWPTSQPQQRQIQVMSVTYTTAHGNARPLTHWAWPGIEPATSWLLVGFVSAAPRWELPIITC